MNAYKTEVVLSEEGRLSLHDLPFHVGETVEVIVLETAKNGHAPTTTNGNATNGVTNDGASNAVEDDILYRMDELLADLPDIEGAPTDWAENFDAYRFGLKKADDA